MKKIHIIIICLLTIIFTSCFSGNKKHAIDLVKNLQSPGTTVEEAAKISLIKPKYKASLSLFNEWESEPCDLIVELEGKVNPKYINPDLFVTDELLTMLPLEEIQNAGNFLLADIMGKKVTFRFGVVLFEERVFLTEIRIDNEIVSGSNYEFYINLLLGDEMYFKNYSNLMIKSVYFPEDDFYF